MNQQIRHHLTDALLMAHAAGSLPEAFALTVAVHVTLCDDCRARLGAFDSVGGALLEAGDGTAMSEGSLQATLAAAKAGGTPRPAPRRASELPAPLGDYIGDSFEAARWRPVGMGVRQAMLRTGRGATARLLHIPAGGAVPDHGHRGTELTLVLQGAFSDATARFARGDIEIATEDLEHSPVADAGEDCICLAATDAPLRFRGWPARLAQPFLRI